MGYLRVVCTMDSCFGEECVMRQGGEDELEAREAGHSGRWPEFMAGSYDGLVLEF